MPHEHLNGARRASGTGDQSRHPRSRPGIQFDQEQPQQATCAHATRNRTTFTLGGVRRCLRCALRYRPLLRRSALTAIVVGTLLLGINQGTVLVSGDIPPALAWQIPLTYVVPFCVATWGALSNSRDS